MKDASLPRFRLSLLARFQLTGPDGPVELTNKKLAGLLAYLACTAPVPQSREKLATLLWGSHFEAQAQQNLRQGLYRLRRALGQDVLVSDDEQIRLAPGVIECDAVRFQALIREGSASSLAAAVGLYKDQLLSDVTIAEDAWADWVAAERQRLEGLALDALVRLGEIELAERHADQALESAHRAVAINNLREDAHRLIVQALAAAGRKAEALKHYQQLAALLKRELNTEPDAATRSLVAELGSAQPSNRPPAVGETPWRAQPRPDRPPIAVPPAATTSRSQEPVVGAAARTDPVASAVPVRPGGPEQRQLTVMVCNIVGSAALSARLDPEDMHDLIAAFHSGVSDAAARFDGFVAQYLGDGVHVYFGYPAAHEYDAEQAVRAGLAVLAMVGTLKTGSDVTVQASVGIATGLVVIGEQQGTGDTRQRIAIGEPPTLATRLQASAPPGEIVIAASTRRLVGRLFDCEALPPIATNGHLQPQEAWRVRGESAGVSRFDTRRAGTLSPLVGRQEEIELLLRRWEQAKLGEGRVVLLSGEPGIGKSRIAESLLARLEGEPHVRVRFFCSPHHAHSPLYPFITQLERAAGFDPGSSAQARLDKLEALLRPWAKNLPQDLVLIADLLSVPSEGRYPDLAVGPQQKREMTLTALLDQLEGMATSSPVLIVFEDAHWIDPTSLDLLDRTITRITDLPVLLVVTFRPEFEPTWIGQPHVTVLPLSRFGRRDSAGIIGGVTMGKPLPDSVVEQILAHTDGVPLFVEELTSTLLESGLLRETADGYVLDRPLPALAIPTTLQASLVARLDRLGSARDVALIGAAIGREFSHELIGAVADLPATELDAAVERLTTSGLVSRRGTPPTATYSFKHALVQDAAYVTMLRSRRRQLHSTIARILIDQFPTMVETLPEVVAWHFTEAGLAAEAIDYWIKAGRLASARSASREAVSSYERALSLLAALPESAIALEQAVDIRLELRASLMLLGDGRQVLQRLREAEALAERLNDDGRRSRVCALLTHVHSLFGELDEAVATGARALEIARRLGNLRLRVLGTTSLEQVHYFRGDYARVVELATDNLAALPASEWIYDYFTDAALPPIHDRFWLVMSLAQLGRFVQATEYEGEAFQLAESIRHPYSGALVHNAAGTHHLLKGDWIKARPLFERAIALARTGNLALLLPNVVASSARVLAQLGETSEALNRLREGEQLLDRYAANGFRILAWAYHALGCACLRLGRLDEARRLGDRALEISQRQPGFAAHALHLLGDVAAHPDRLDAERAETHYRQALALAEPRDMRPLVAHCHLGLGKLYRRTDKARQAQQRFNTATAMYREMDMPFWPDQAEAEMRAVQ